MEKRTVYIVGGGVLLVFILLALGVLFILPHFLSSNAQTTASPTTTATTTPAAKQKNVYAPYLKQYGPSIKSKIAQGLHQTPQQLTTQLQAGKSLSDIATTQKISDTQLQNIITTAFTTSLQPAVDSGALTQKQVGRLVKMMLKNRLNLDLFLTRIKDNGSAAQNAADSMLAA